MNVLITGASGYLGSSLLRECQSQNINVTAVVRNTKNFNTEICHFVVNDIVLKTDWSKELCDIDVVIHTVARAHVLHDSSDDPLIEFRKVNTHATLNLAREAVRAGVKQFIFISSIGVNGNVNNKPFSECDVPNPQEPYAVSKYEAENGLLKLSKDKHLNVVIIRPPLVYGPNAPGNFDRLVRMVFKFPILPFGSIYNKRSFVALDNLTNFIIHCIGNPNALNEVFLISDGEDVSTTELLYKLSTVFDKKLYLLPVSVEIMRFCASLFGKERVADSLFGSLQIDSTKARNVLKWSPVVTMNEELLKISNLY